MVLDPIYLANLVLSIIIVIIGYAIYKINKNEVAIYVAIGFLLFGFTHFSFLVGLREPLDRYIFVIRIIAYVVIIYGLYRSWRQTKTQITTLSNKNKQLEIEIRERNRAEKKINESLKEKEILLREIHHRVKNNMQIVSSLLSLQSRYIDDKETFELFRDSQNRVKSMAIVHEKLYQSKSISKIDFEENILKVL